MRDYKASSSDNIVVDDDQVTKRLEDMKDDERRRALRDEINHSSHIDRPATPDYEDLNKRFENLLNMIEKRNPPEILDDNVFHEEAQEDGVVHYSCNKPPDILDFTTKDHFDLELEEVNITFDGMEIVQSTSSQPLNDYDDETKDLPDHLKEMVNKAISEMK